MKHWLYYLVGLPFSFATKLRKFLYTNGIIKQTSFPFPVIVVGNIRVGGTGKTPHVAHLTQLLINQGYKPLILSRGYGRSTKGFISINNLHKADEVGDEPLLLYHTFKGKVPVIVSESRVKGIELAINSGITFNVVVMDDGLQHLSLTPSFKIVLTKFSDPFFSDHVLPLGRLRESRTSIKQADVVIATKTAADLNPDERTKWLKKCKSYLQNKKPILFTTALSIWPLIEKNVVVVAGLADNQPFFDDVKTRYKCLSTYGKRDHHAYSYTELEGYESNALALSAEIVTTAKDWVKIVSLTSRPHLYHVIRQEVKFLENGGMEFEQMILQHLATFKS